ncbi:uncharacterized protein PGTG_02120 [Puccinia graminis f. sp. tritici CRL 75-36-700-3]|uniref:Uncharacterized protein n=1 Tax=Puccinia graminis f. sp. tritici (strain CRL 75-36-700-3 / race SCCL) TaxID=418459 RepID=E3JX84_PUCGT|nr:uncharacterized protein PGTG_02120 [Puccinia graminis f. sp. tritici CRL 75-36-700-3]EFP76659.2 hypothetical protein PGTG_02120 [Puccinia graminis f. sp. tritici CRL 75-36-700-3]
MAPAHPDIRADADIRLLFLGKTPSAAAGRYPPALAGILGYPPFKGPARHRLEGFPSSRRGASLPTGRVSFQSARYILADWKGFLPAGKVHPRRLEGLPSSRQGTSSGCKWVGLTQSRPETRRVMGRVWADFVRKSHDPNPTRKLSGSGSGRCFDSRAAEPKKSQDGFGSGQHIFKFDPTRPNLT